MVALTSTGSIPAPAGEPGNRACTLGQGRVYPRACGGNHVVVAVRAGLVGVYPRACGGTASRWALVQRGSGLSPRLRGNHSTMRRRGTPTGSIPAPAGEPRVVDIRKSETKVYPRACGGTFDYVDERSELMGLSPRLRGNRICSEITTGNARSIPAPAGEPRQGHGRRSRHRVYPRACGGTLANEITTNVRQWSIPAPAGEPGWRCWTMGRLRVYPRACGGTR